jgi:hypothetical protein
MKKLYIKKWTEKTVDDEELQVFTAYESMVKDLSFIIFIGK